MMLAVQAVFLSKVFAQNIAINASGSLPDTSAMLDVSSTQKGFLAPRMTTAQQNAIAVPANGLIVFNTSTNSLNVNTGSTSSPVWQPLAISGSGIGSLNGITANAQTFATDSAGKYFTITSSGTKHTFNLPDAAAANRGVINTTTQVFNGNKTFNNPLVAGGTFAASSTVTLSGILSGAATDSIVTINGSGVINKRTIADVTGNSWGTSGNGGTTAANFIGTSNNSSFRFRTNSLERMVVDSNGRVGIGTNAPPADFTLSQGAGISNARGIRFTGNSIGGTSTGTGFSMALGYNTAGNKQLWLGDADYLGNNTGTFFRFSASSGYCIMDAVSGDNNNRRTTQIGVGGDLNSAVILGSDLNAAAPGSYVWGNGNMAIGNGYRSNAAPVNGLIVQGKVGVGTSSAASTLQVGGSIAIAITTVTNADATLSDVNGTVIFNTGNTNRIVNLPSASSATGRIYIVKKNSTGTGRVTVTPATGETIDGAATYALTASWRYVNIQSDGTNWLVVGNN